MDNKFMKQRGKAARGGATAGCITEICSTKDATKANMVERHG